MPTDAERPRPVTKLPDHTAPLKDWLREHGLGSATEAGFEPHALYHLAAGRRNLPPMPPEVLDRWHGQLHTDRVMWGQSAAAFIYEARKAGVVDPTIRRALLLDDGVDLDQHAQKLRDDARALGLLRGERGWVFLVDELSPRRPSEDG